MLKVITSKGYIILLLAVCLLVGGCGVKKDKPKVKFMKNLTAHYNIYFNAKEALEESSLAIKNAHEDDFSQLLPIFPKPDREVSANETENLDEVIGRANLIAIEKYESNWLDDSYLLLADAEYLKGDFYNALEYYSYVGITFEKEKKNRIKAYLGEVRSDFALGLIADADSVLNLAIGLGYKYKRDQVAASRANLAIENNDIHSAVKYLKLAVGFSKNSYEKTRWRYTLAQLQEIEGDTQGSLANYAKIAKSNAAFEMAFNANLSQIRISENEDGKTFDKIATLAKLLKEDKNQQLKDQIYYQIAKAYQEQSELEKAKEYYTISAHTVPGTPKQKGLSYLRLAELNFETLKDYKKSQLYYDSTLKFLPKTYPGYASIATKANNLQYLADRLVIVENGKESLYLATIDETEINRRVDSVFLANEKARIEPQQKEPTSQLSSISGLSSNNKSTGTFYFYNDAAIGQGYSEFKRRFGNRKLADDWRVSSGNLATISDNNVDLVDGFENKSDLVISRDSIKTKLISTIPYNEVEKQALHQRISTALYEIALFYKDVLKDEAEAVEAFNAIIQNYPQDRNLANIYYQLYRLASASNAKQSEIYKQKLLTLFPNTIYAKAISEPNYGKEREFRENVLKSEYAELYQHYEQKDYDKVLSRLNALKPRLTEFKNLEATFLYLEALALGHTNKTPVYLASLNQIVKNYPDNQTVTPIVKQQIEFIGKNRTAFDQRPTALLTHHNRDNSQSEQFYIAPLAETPVKAKATIAEETKPTQAPDKDIKSVPLPVASTVDEETKIDEATVIKQVLQAEKQPDAVLEKPVELVFSSNERQRHLIIIDISDPKQNIAQPFSKLSRYFYSKFDPSKVKLVIRVVGGTEKFIIISGDFYTKAQVDIVANELKENLPKIMEGQTTHYQQFVVTEDNLKLLTDRASIEQYLKSITPK